MSDNHIFNEPGNNYNGIIIVVILGVIMFLCIVGIALLAIFGK